VKHTTTENPWTLIPEDYSNVKPYLDMTNVLKTTNTAFARAPPTVLMKHIRQIAACLGTVDSYKLSDLTNTFEQVVEIAYANRESMWLADGFQLGSVQMATAQSFVQARDTLLEIDEQVSEEDRLVAACISAGTRFGSIEALRAIRKEEELLSGAVQSTPEDKVQGWKASDPPSGSNQSGSNDFQAAADNLENQGDHNENTGNDEASDMERLTRDPDSKYKFGTKHKPTPRALEFQRLLDSMTYVEAIEGLTFIPDFITESEEQTLLQLSRGWQWDQEVSTRQTAQFGFHYEYASQTIREGREWPAEVKWLRDRLLEAGIFDELPNEMIATKLTPPHGFGGHIDHVLHFGPTVVILGMQAEVNFVFYDMERRFKQELRSERRSLIVLQGEARYKYHHAIREGIEDEWKNHIWARGIRISLTLRTMLHLNAVNDKH